MTEILTANQTGILKAVALLKQGELVAFPTETVYGLGAVASNEQAVKAVFQAKGRPNDNPLIVHVSNVKMVEKYAENIPEIFWKLSKAFWPGSLTLILKAKHLPTAVTAGLETAAFRMPNSKVTLDLIEALDEPIVGPSANTSGRPSPTEASHVYHDLEGKIAAILDGGASQVGIESTVLDLTGEVPLILRPGGVSIETLCDYVRNISYDQHLLAETETPKAPGMKYQHYAPKVPVYLFLASEVSKVPDISNVAVVADQAIVRQFKQAEVFELTQDNNLKLATHHLYRALRQLDDTRFSAIFVQAFSDQAAVSYMNRLNKASGGKKVEDFL